MQEFLDEPMSQIFLEINYTGFVFLSESYLNCALLFTAPCMAMLRSICLGNVHLLQQPMAVSQETGWRHWVI